jgi:NarL family two-component system sensor histidine kinase LiaS
MGDETRRGWRMGRLRWRLARSYVLVTLVVALAFAVALAASSYGDQRAAAARRPYLARTLQVWAAPQLAPYLDRGMPSREALERWATMFLSASVGGDGDSKLPRVAPSRLVTVVDRDGRALASASDPSWPAADPAAGHGVRAVVRAALAGAADGADLVRALPGGETVVAAPVVAPDGRVLGAVYDVQPAPWSFGLPDLLLFIAFMAVAASVVGAGYGALAARGLVRRLGRLARAAHAWSGGDFAVAVRDRTRDELGQLARDLDGMAEQLRGLFATRQELATVEERQRLARDLHDSVKQDVFATALLLGAARALLPADREQEHAYLAEAEALAEHARHELTALIHALRPAALEGKRLDAALRDYASDWSRRTGVAVDLRVAPDCPVSPNAGAALFRVAQEALANVARHSGADRVEVELDRDEEMVRLRVGDNGKGFDMARAASVGVGLASMRERVEAHGGTLAISGAAGGATVEARIPSGPAGAAEEAGR